MNDFRTELRTLINRYSIENGSNTPDFILAQYLSDVLKAYDETVSARDEWYGIHPAISDSVGR